MLDSLNTQLAALIDLERTLADVRERIQAFDTFDRLTESIETLIWSAHLNLRKSEDPSLPTGAAKELVQNAVAALNEAAATVERLKQELEREESPATEAVQ
jgi:DNA repair ATPase RecN